jgi:hypothetical protein
MGSKVRGRAKKSRIEFRIDSDFKNKFSRFCKDCKETPSIVARQALEQAVYFGDFKSQLFELLHNYPEAKFHFEKFLHLTHINSHKVGAWFDELLGSEEKKLIENTPSVFLAGLQDVIVTGSGKKFLKDKLHGVREGIL